MTHTVTGLTGYTVQMAMKYEKGVLLCGGVYQNAMTNECFYHVIGSTEDVVKRTDLVMPFACCKQFELFYEAPDGQSAFILGGRDMSKYEKYVSLH